MSRRTRHGLPDNLVRAFLVSHAARPSEVPTAKQIPALLSSRYGTIDWQAWLRFESIDAAAREATGTLYGDMLRDDDWNGGRIEGTFRARRFPSGRVVMRFSFSNGRAT